jgi:TatA/E family protein of Tat protein translocase
VPFLSPAKILVILVVALLVLGPDKLPKMAKQIGGLWGDFRKFRQRFESDVRGSFPDLPSTEKIAQAVRSPISFLDDLADTHGGNGSSVPANGSAATEARTGAEQGDPEPVQPARPSEPEEPRIVPRSVIADPGTIVHQVRSTGGVVPDDPGLN